MCAKKLHSAHRGFRKLKHRFNILFLTACSFLLSNTIHISRAHALEDFACPEGFECPDELMPEVEFWTKVYGEVDANHAIFFNQETRHIYSEMDIGDSCEKNSTLPMAEKTRIAKTLDATEAENLKYKCGLKDMFLKGVPTYKTYQPYIQDTLQKNNLPLAIQYLPFSESSYNPVAVSNAGAVGTWQLMPSVARHHGLVVNTIVDERRDPIKSTVVAAQYFVDAFKCIHGTACSITPDLDSNILGAFAMTSYIYGVTGTQNAIKQMGTTNYLTVRSDYDGPSFGPYTRNYYAKFLAVYHVATHEVDYFGDIIEPQPKIETQTLKFTKPTSAPPFARKLSLELELLKILNLKYLDRVWNGSKSIPSNYTLEIPNITDDLIRKYGKIIAINKPVQRDNIKIEPIKPRSISLQLPVPQAEIKPLTPRTLPDSIPQKKTNWGTILQKVFK